MCVCVCVCARLSLCLVAARTLDEVRVFVEMQNSMVFFIVLVVFLACLLRVKKRIQESIQSLNSFKAKGKNRKVPRCESHVSLHTFIFFPAFVAVGALSRKTWMRPKAGKVLAWKLRSLGRVFSQMFGRHVPVASI